MILLTLRTWLHVLRHPTHVVFDEYRGDKHNVVCSCGKTFL